ncbi:hypothetical protein CEXT_554021 [Caerostris extrusa]|uniref:Uncharacterized protein n=1 Tax=Caerostris extrusa TaxID=172846 RepID=A0AAV4PB94_CAEEX|nr:hypothetical protein CEXT_554021 [Caerostris extrusa]
MQSTTRILNMINVIPLTTQRYKSRFVFVYQYVPNGSYIVSDPSFSRALVPQWYTLTNFSSDIFLGLRISEEAPQSHSIASGNRQAFA